MKIQLRKFSKRILGIILIYLVFLIAFGIIFTKFDLSEFIINFSNFKKFSTYEVTNKFIFETILININLFISIAIGLVLGDTYSKRAFQKQRGVKHNPINQGNWYKLKFKMPVNKLLFFFISTIVIGLVIFLIFKSFSIDQDFNAIASRSFRFKWFLVVYFFIGVYFGRLLSISNKSLNIAIKILIYLFILLTALTEASRDFLLTSFPFSYFSIVNALKVKNKINSTISISIDLSVTAISLIFVFLGRSYLNLSIFNVSSLLSDSFFYVTGFSFFNFSQMIANIDNVRIMDPMIILINLFPLNLDNILNIDERTIIGPMYDAVRPIPLAVHAYSSYKFITTLLFITVGWTISKILNIKNNLITRIIIYSLLIYIYISFFQYYPKQTFRGLHMLLLVNFFLHFFSNKKIKI